MTAAEIITALQAAAPAETDAIRKLLQVGDRHTIKQIDSRTGKEKRD